MSRAIGALAIIGVVFVMYMFVVYDEELLALSSTVQPEWVGKTFSLGETINILERPQLYTDIFEDVEQIIFDRFTEDELPQSYRDLAAEQAAANNPEPEESISGHLTTAEVVTPTDQHVKGDDKQAKIITTGKTASVFTRGEVVPVVGKLNVPNKPAPLFYNIIAYCCGNDDDALFQQAHISTDSQGNFVYKIISTTDFPIGVYDVTVSTLSADNRRLIEYTWQFELLSPG